MGSGGEEEDDFVQHLSLSNLVFQATFLKITIPLKFMDALRDML